MNRTTRPPDGSGPCSEARHACPAFRWSAMPDNPWPRCSALELGTLPSASPVPAYTPGKFGHMERP